MGIGPILREEAEGAWDYMWGSLFKDKEYSFHPEVKKTIRSRTLVFNPSSAGELWIPLESTWCERGKFTHPTSFLVFYFVFFPITSLYFSVNPI